MKATVRDDAARPVTITGAAGGIRRNDAGTRSAIRRVLGAGVIALVMAAGPTAGAADQPPAAARPGELGVRIREADSTGHRLVVPVSRSVILDTAVPVARAQAVESTIAAVQSISPTQFMVTGVGYGVTQVILWSANNEQTIVQVNVELDVEQFNKMLRDVDPLSDAAATSVKGNILLSGTVSGPDAAERMVQLARLFLPPGTANPESLVHNHLRVSGEQQVLLRCTVAEVSRQALRQLGVNGWMAGDDFRDAFVVSQIGGINPIDIGAAGDVNAQATIPFLTGADGIPLSSNVPLSLGFPRVQMQVFLQALAENSLLKVLARPDLVAVSGETASFLAGGEFPIPVPQSGSASGAVTIEFREFGVRVNFTPVVLGLERIRLKVRPEVSETDYSTALQIQGYVVPGLTQRRVDTTVEVDNGATLAIAGLLSEEVRGIASRIPALGDVPVLGALFRSTEYKRRETELIILVTPEIIAALEPQQLAKVPGDDVTTPNDFELYALGLLEGGSIGTTEADAANGTLPPVRVAPLKSQPQELSLHGPWGYSTAEDVR